MSDQFLADLRAEIADAGARVDGQRDRAVSGGSGGGDDSGGSGGRSGRRTRRIAAMAAAAAVVALLAGVMFASRPDVAQADVEVIRVGDELVVRLSDVETRPDDIVEAAAEAGLDVTVEQVPVGPSNVGRFIGSSGTAELPEMLTVEGSNGSSFNGFRIPADYDGRIELTLGRAARAGEGWTVTSDATAKGEALECEHLVGRPLAGVLDRVAAAGIDDVRVLIPEAGGEVAPDDLGSWATAPVQAVTSSSAGQVFIDAGASPLLDSLAPARSGC